MNGKLFPRRAASLCVTALLAVRLIGHAQQPRPAAEPLPERASANLWMQTSAEYRALCFQVFNLALKEVERAVQTSPRVNGVPAGADGKPLAVVADLDETILDNSRYQTELLLRRKTFSEASWQQWVENNAGEVELVPGAGSFVEAVERLSVDMVYVSNRAESQRNSTIEALARLGINTSGLESIEAQRLLLKTSSSSKEARRQQVFGRYSVVCFLGDNLADFPGEFGSTVESRAQRADAHRELWGSRWFILPNPAYGDWERVLGNDPARYLKRAKDQRFISP